MNWDDLKNNWNQYKTQIRGKFDKLSDDDINAIRDNFRENLTKRVQNRYGISYDDAQKKVDDFVTNLKKSERV